MLDNKNVILGVIVIVAIAVVGIIFFHIPNRDIASLVPEGTKEEDLLPPPRNDIGAEEATTTDAVDE